MTAALAGLAGALLVALVLVVWRQVQARGRHTRALADVGAAKRSVEIQLAETHGAVEDLERRLRVAQIGAEAAERLRLQREWAELAGPGAPLPLTWDGSLASTVGCELEIIREVVGTPATMEVEGDAETPEGFRLALGAEFLRAAALDADEMRVRVGERLMVEGSAGTSGRPASTPHLDSITRLVQEAGAELLVDVSESGFTASLTFGD
ncbi:MAG TPA: hypothetical protein VFJ79_08415 [Acidimicrobiales bacterium]|nr:hypothetical protein [Acidimicrobiales bacterium]